MVAEGVILHVDADKIVQSRSWEAQDARNLLCVEEIRSLVPVDPHATEVVSEQIVERIARQET